MSGGKPCEVRRSLERKDLDVVNGSTNMTLAGLLFVQQPEDGQPDPRIELEAWNEAIAQLDRALADLAAARAVIDAESTMLERIEAGMVLEIEGSNAEVRKAKLTLALADDPGYQTHLAALRAGRERVAEADRRVMVIRERCRLLRAALALREPIAA